MARGNAAAGRPGGGAGIPSLRPGRARVATGLAAVAAAGAVGAYTALAGGRFAELGEGFAFGGAFVLALGVLFRFAETIPWAIALAGGGYIAGRAGHGVADGWAAVVGAALLLAAELATWSIDHDRRIHEERALLVSRTLLVSALVAASALAGFVFVGAAAVSASAGILLSAVGMAAAIAAVTVILRLLRGRHAAEEPEARVRRP